MSKSWDPLFTSLRRWRLRNFKSVADADLPLAPLTLVVGANSVGKSSLLQSILMMAQASANESDGPFPLNGTVVQLGEFDQTLSDFTDRAETTIEVSAEFALGRYRLRESFKPSLVTVADSLEVGDEETAQQTRLSVLVALEAGDKPSDARVHHSEIQVHAGDQMLLATSKTRSADQPSVEEELSRLRAVQTRAATYSAGYVVNEELRDVTRNRRRVTRRLGQGMEIFPGAPGDDPAIREINAVRFVAGLPIGGRSLMPAARLAIIRAIEFTDINIDQEARAKQAALGRHYTAAAEMTAAQGVEFFVQHMSRAVTMFLSDAPPKRMGVSKSLPRSFKNRALVVGLARRTDFETSLLPRLVEHFSGDGGDLDRLGPYEPSLLADWTSEWCGYLQTSVHYLGPLREDPKVSYPHGLSGSPHLPIGRKGEHTAATLLGDRGDFRRGAYPGPGGSRATTLGQSLREWVQDFGLAHTVEWSDEGRHGVGLTVNGRDLTSVGTGVSQILPVLVVCLQARPGELVLLEQPELHLNPAMQQRLGDFFLEMVRSGRQLIIESHSEYLVTRLRRNVVEDRTDRTRRLFTLLFASQRDGKTSFEVVDTRPDGSFDFDMWPDGFFDQAGDDVTEIFRTVARRRAEGSLGT